MNVLCKIMQDVFPGYHMELLRICMQYPIAND